MRVAMTLSRAIVLAIFIGSLCGCATNKSSGLKPYSGYGFNGKNL